MTGQNTNDTSPSAALPIPFSPRGSVLFHLNVVLIIISTLAVTARVYIRGFVLKNFGADDWGSILALISSVAFSALEMNACRYAGGHHIWDLPPANIAKYFQLVTSLQLTTVTACFLTRLTILIFLRRLVKGPRWNRAIWFSVAFMTVYWLAFSLAFLLQCRPVYTLWDCSKATYCISESAQRNLVLSYSGLAVGLDLGLWIAPIALVTSKMMFTKMKMRMIAVFSVGAVAVVSALLKLIFTSQADLTHDFPYEIYYTAIFHNLEPHVGIIVGCFPALHPLFRWLRKKITGLSTVKGSRAGGAHYAYAVGTGPSASAGVKSGGGGTHHEMYNVHGRNMANVTTGGRNDSQELMVVGEGGIYKHTEVEVTSVTEAGSLGREDDGSSLERGA